MYLDFISDIANVGDVIRIICEKEVFEGTIVKITSAVVAIRLEDGSLVVKKDEEIDGLSINPLERTDKDIEYKKEENPAAQGETTESGPLDIKSVESNPKKGQLLFEIEPQEYTNAAGLAKGNLDNARAQQEYFNKQCCW